MEGIVELSGQRCKLTMHPPVQHFYDVYSAIISFSVVVFNSSLLYLKIENGVQIL